MILSAESDKIAWTVGDKDDGSLDLTFCLILFFQTAQSPHKSYFSLEATTDSLILNGYNNHTPIAPKQTLGKGWHLLHL